MLPLDFTGFPDASHTLRLLFQAPAGEAGSTWLGVEAAPEKANGHVAMDLADVVQKLEEMAKITIDHHLVGGIPTPLKNISQLG